ncbi:hypothetical protein [Komagataeibacter sp. NFXK3]
MYYQWSFCELAGPMFSGHEDREIMEDLKLRSLPPEDIFCFPLVDIWRARVWNLLSDYVTADVKAAFVQMSPEWIASDDLSWLDDLIFDVTGKICQTKDLLGSRLRQEYRAFRVGHATRTNDLSSFYKHGLRFLRAGEIEDRARSIFLNGQSLDATEDRLQKAIDDLHARDTPGGREGHLYFCANERSLITRSGGSGHYLIYGSEYLYCLGMRMASTWETKRLLKGIGRPTMFVCDIPMAFIPASTLQEFAGIIIAHLFCELVDELNSDALHSSAGSALSLAVDISADHIVGHYHPQKIYDPLWSA